MTRGKVCFLLSCFVSFCSVWIIALQFPALTPRHIRTPFSLTMQRRMMRFAYFSCQLVIMKGANLTAAATISNSSLSAVEVLNGGWDLNFSDNWCLLQGCAAHHGRYFDKCVCRLRCPVILAWAHVSFKCKLGQTGINLKPTLLGDLLHTIMARDSINAGRPNLDQLSNPESFSRRKGRGKWD